MDRAVDLLLAVAAAHPEAATAPALARTCGLNRATAWRLLKTLQVRGLVTVDESTGRYSIGLTAMELGNAAGPDALIAAAHPVLERVCAADRGDRLAGRARHGRADLRRRGHARRRAHRELATAARCRCTPPPPARRCSRSCPPSRCSGCWPAALTRFTDTTITDPDALAAELAATRARGYGVCAGELESSLYGVSAPVLDRNRRPLAVLSIWGPKDRVPQEKFAELGEVAVAAAAEIGSARLPNAPVGA